MNICTFTHKTRKFPEFPRKQRNTYRYTYTSKVHLEKKINKLYTQHWNTTFVGDIFFKFN